MSWRWQLNEVSKRVITKKAKTSSVPPQQDGSPSLAQARNERLHTCTSTEQVLKTLTEGKAFSSWYFENKTELMKRWSHLRYIYHIQVQ